MLEFGCFESKAPAKSERQKVFARRLVHFDYWLNTNGSTRKDSARGYIESIVRISTGLSDDETGESEYYASRTMAGHHIYSSRLPSPNSFPSLPTNTQAYGDKEWIL